MRSVLLQVLAAAVWAAGIPAPARAQTIEVQELAPPTGIEPGRQVRRPPVRPGGDGSGVLPPTTTERTWIAPPTGDGGSPEPGGTGETLPGLAVIPVPEGEEPPGDTALLPADDGSDGGTGEAEDRPRTLLPGARIARGTGEAGADVDGTAEGETSFFDRFLRAPPGTGQGQQRPLRPISLGPTRETAGASFRVLDIIAGTTETVDVRAGEMAVSGRLRLHLVACEVPVSGSPVGSVALLQVWDTKHTAAEEPDFSGWMFAESPALSALDHPRYDVWLISCSTEAAEAGSGNR